MMNSTLAPQTSRITAGPWTHRGRIFVDVMLGDGTAVSVVVPDDLVALIARVDALEAKLEPPPAA
jgi:hypothetical protein